MQPISLALSRALAWAILISGWIAIAAFAFQFARGLFWGFVIVATWLVCLGASASLGRSLRSGRVSIGIGLILGAIFAGGGLIWSVHGGGTVAVLFSVLGWSAMTALASGVVRKLRFRVHKKPDPPVVEAALGGLTAALVIGDLGDLVALATKMAMFLGAISAILTWLQITSGAEHKKQGCRAGLFDCSLPAWPTGAWRDPGSWPFLLSSLVMLPMMATLPLMVMWCADTAVSGEWMILVHVGAMFGSALILRLWRDTIRPASLSAACVGLLVSGALFPLIESRANGLLGLAILHGAAWGVAWSTQLWSPARRSDQNSSPLLASLGYAALALLFGVAVQYKGADGAVGLHVLMALLALLAWLYRLVRGQRKAEISAPTGF
jgi:hypothetical protein